MNCLYCAKDALARGLCSLHWQRWRHELQMEAPRRFHRGWMHEGYRQIATSDGRELNEHRWLMEQHLGRNLHTDEIVPHKNGKRTDNRLENLVVVDRAEHTRLHLKQAPIKRVCIICGKSFKKSSRFTYQKVRTCSNPCRSKLIWRTRNASKT